MNSKNTAPTKEGPFDNTRERKDSLTELLFTIVSIVLIAIIGYVIFGTHVSEGDIEMGCKVMRTDEAKVLLVSAQQEIETHDIVAIITPTVEQMARLRGKREGRKIISQNRKRTHKNMITELGLSLSEIRLLKKAGIIGADSNIFKESDLYPFPDPKNQTNIGINQKTYPREEVEYLHTVTTGYIIKRD